MLYIGLILLALLGLIISSITNLWFGLAFFVASSAGFIYQGIAYITADPPHYAIVTIFGKRTKKIKKEGYRFFALRPWVEGYIEKKVTKINQDFAPEDVRTPDRAELQIIAALTFTPTDLVEYANAGGEEGVKNIFDDIVPERIREWAFSSDEGPQTWLEARGASEEATAILLKAIVGEGLTEIPDYAQSIPTAIWLKYFDKPRKKPIKKKEIETAGENWEKVDAIFNELSIDQQTDLRTAVEKRRKEIKDARGGNGNFTTKALLGVTINRLNVPVIREKGELAKAAELEVVKQQQRKGEVFEVDTDIIKAKQLMAAAEEVNEPLNFENAYRITLEWKAAREGHGFTIPGISPVIIGLAQTLLGRRDK